MIVPSVLSGQHKIHVAPDHWFKLIFPADLTNSVQMPLHNSGTILISVSAQIVPKTKLECLIHPDMDPFSGK